MCPACPTGNVQGVPALWKLRETQLQMKTICSPSPRLISFHAPGRVGTGRDSPALCSENLSYVELLGSHGGGAAPTHQLLPSLTYSRTFHLSHTTPKTSTQFTVIKPWWFSKDLGFASLEGSSKYSKYSSWVLLSQCTICTSMPPNKTAGS